MTDPQYLEESKAVSCHLIGIRDLGGGLSDSLRKAVERQLAEGRRVVVAFEGGMRPAHDEAIAELRKYDSVELCAVPGDVDDTDIPGEVHRIFPGLHISSVSKIGELSTRVHRLVYHLIPADDYSIRRSGDAVEFSFTKGGLSPLCSARVGDREYPLAVQGDRYSFVIPPCDFAALSTGNVISFCDAHGEDFKVICGNKLRKRLKVAHTRLVPLPGDMVCYLQEFYRGTDLIIRRRNRTDSLGQRVRMGFAYLCSRFVPESKRAVILYEKNSERYEESASILYERLMDGGYRNAYFILDSASPHWNRVPEGYRANLLRKYSFKHYLKLFSAKSLIASETVSHSVELRPVSPFLRYWMRHAGFNYVFLQHGPTYMISLDAEGRTFYKQKVRAGYVNRVVVDSQLEADHFVQLGGADPETLYICGMLKFDRAVRDDVHDRIVIMPTWRPWEAVLAASDFTQTSYYKFVEKILACVPEDLLDKVIVLPHPLIGKYAAEADSPLTRYMRPDLTHDEVLRMTDTLITDYSSISFDAFYRGANVIFDWEQKDETVAHYGATAKLMLTEDLAFGRVCYDDAALSEAVREVYGGPQEQVYIDRYDQIISFHDGRNTDRFIEMIRNDHIL